MARRQRTSSRSSVGRPDGVSKGDADGLDYVTVKASYIERDRGLADDELMGQMTTMVMAGAHSQSARDANGPDQPFPSSGHETSATLLAWILHALAKSPASQNKLREELLRARMDPTATDLPVEVVGALPFLDAVVVRLNSLALTDLSPIDPRARSVKV